MAGGRKGNRAGPPGSAAWAVARAGKGSRVSAATFRAACEAQGLRVTPSAERSAAKVTAPNGERRVVSHDGTSADPGIFNE